MIDRHIHIERGPYTKEWLSKFIDTALKRGMTKIGILEHTHRFVEFKDIYDSINVNTDYGKYQSEWLNKRSTLQLSEYKQFIEEMKKENFPIEIEFGLEVDYFPFKKDDIRKCLNGFDWDFLTGSIHWIDGWGFDHPKTKDSWNDKNVDKVYERYYELMIELIESGLVDTIAHPDSIKCFNYVPNKDMKQTYQDVANKMKENDVKAELNTGLHYRYGHNDLGMNDDLFQILIKEKVKMITVSDAHSPEDVSMFIKEATAKLEGKVK